MSYKNQVAYEALRIVDTATLTGSYAALGSPTTHPAYILCLGNGGDEDVTISTNGTTDMEFVPAGADRYYRYGKFNDQSSPQLPAGTQFFVKGTAGTGSFSISLQYVVTN